MKWNRKKMKWNVINNENNMKKMIIISNMNMKEIRIRNKEIIIINKEENNENEEK